MAVSIEAARGTLRAREAAERALGRARKEKILARVADVASALRRAGASRVVLFGSLAGDHATARSDLDLAVSDLPGERYFSALAEAMRLAGCPVDLVRLEDASESLRRRIAAEGQEL